MLWIFILAIIMPISLGHAAAATCNSEKSDCCAGRNNAEITWEHAVNSKHFLKTTLDDDKIQMIEADVIIGSLITKLDTKPSAEKSITSTDGVDSNVKDSNAEQIPVMGHPPDDSSDLSLEDFLKQVSEHNANSEPKGIKLDFKSIDAVKRSLPVLMMYKDIKSDIWINADILDGPGKPTATAVNAREFFDAVKTHEKLKKTTLSIGWTTGMDKKEDVVTYSQENVEQMVKIIKDNNLENSHPITFPVRAAIAVESKRNLQTLFNEVSKMMFKVTFTIWTGNHDTFEINELQDFISTFGVDKVYVDLPEDLKKQLDLKSKTSGASTLVHYGLLNLASILFALFTRNGIF